jgi:hypothetical protein
MLDMPWTLPGMGFGLGSMFEGCALFGMADCRSRSESALQPSIFKSYCYPSRVTAAIQNCINDDVLVFYRVINSKWKAFLQ